MKPSTLQPKSETVLPFVIGTGLLLLAGSDLHLLLLSPSENVWLRERANVLSGLFLFYGTAFLFVAALSLYFLSRGKSLAGETLKQAENLRALVLDRLTPALRHSLASNTSPVRLLLIVAIGIAVRVYFMAQPVRYDEAYTFLQFGNGPILNLFDYPYPNNHVLNTILVKFSTIVFGEHPIAMRLPALIAGIGSIPLLFCLARTLSNTAAAEFASIAAAVFPYLVLFSTNARGYSLLVFLTLALIWISAETARAPSFAASFILATIAALALLTIPSAAFAVAGVYLWYASLLLINGNKFVQVVREFAIPCAVMTLGMTVILYTPVFLVSKGIDPVIANDYVRALPAAVFLGQIYPHVADTVADFSRDIPAPVLFFGLVLMGFGAYGAAKQRNRPLLLLLPAILFASAILFLAKRSIPFPRTWIFLIPIVILLAGAGWAYCIEALPRWTLRPFREGVMFAGAGYALFLVSSNAVAKYHDTGAFPEAPRIAAYLKPLIEAGGEVHASVPADYPTYFYLWHSGLTDFRPGKHDSNEQTKYFVVQKHGYIYPNPIQERIQEPVQKVTDIGGAAVFRNSPKSIANAAAGARFRSASRYLAHKHS